MTMTHRPPATAGATASIPGATPQSIAAALTAPLVDLIERYELFVKTLESHRSAISNADTKAIDAAIKRERELLGDLLRLDSTCRDALQNTGAAHASGWTISRLAHAVGGEDGHRLSEASAYLKALTSRAEILQRSVREASSAMSSHIDGLVRQVTQRLSHAGTYGAGGRVEVKTPVMSGLDVRL